MIYFYFSVNIFGREVVVARVGLWR